MIAAMTEDAVIIHSHFSHALFYQVLTIEDNLIIAREQRAKPLRQYGAHAEHYHNADGDTHTQIWRR